MQVPSTSLENQHLNSKLSCPKQFLIKTEKWFTVHETIAKRLCLEQGCEMSAAKNWLQEVGKFLYVCHESNIRLTPSEKVDQAWHVFILFTHDYREFCHHFFNRFIDHFPGGEADENRNQYTLCLESLVKYFGYADKAYWPRGISIPLENISCGPCSN
jgi:hypothetical protein